MIVYGYLQQKRTDVTSNQRVKNIDEKPTKIIVITKFY